MTSITYKLVNKSICIGVSNKLTGLPMRLNIEMARAACGMEWTILHATLPNIHSCSTNDVATIGAQIISSVMFTIAMFNRKLLGILRSLLLLHIV